MFAEVSFTVRLVPKTQFSEDTNIIFTNIVSNIGEGYNATTGVFTAPFNGSYTFTLVNHNPGDDDADTTARIRLNDQSTLCVAYTRWKNGISGEIKNKKFLNKSP